MNQSVKPGDQRTERSHSSLMIYIESGIYVVVKQLEQQRSPQPLPLDNGFSIDYAYRVLGIYSPSETSEAFLILSNDRDEIWFISNRHFHTHKILQHSEQFRVFLQTNQASASLSMIK